MIKHNKKRHFVVYIVLILAVLISVIPFLWIVLSSFRSNVNIYNLNFSWKQFSLINYIGVMQEMDIPLHIRNSLFMTAISILLDLLLSSLCAYPLVFMEFKGKNVVFAMLIGTMIIPPAAGMIINYLTISKLHLLDTMLGVILPTAVKPFSIVLLRQAYLGIPKDLLGAMKLDGAGELKIWYHLILPCSVPCLSTIAIFDFIGCWNSFLWPIIVLKTPDKYPLATALQYMNGTLNYKFGYVMAGMVISILPVILVFILLQKKYLETIESAIK